MSEYIERKALFRTIENIPDNELLGNDNTTFVELPTVLDIISEQPIADVQEVVYCKDCKHLYCHSAVDREFYCKHPKGMQGCLNPVEENPYCSYGERKCGDDNG